MTSTLLVNPA
uniref:Uncharacterized protein n=1 Tax=Pseudomonas aeruginosa TaxID=287 RepID=Q9APT8_PSEAI|nr:hypothetical protein [Pseudomonas aeruginosa]